MAKTSKKRARQRERRAERRAKKGGAPEPTPGTLLLRRIRTEARSRHEAALRRQTDAEAREKRQLERAGAQGRAENRTQNTQTRKGKP